MVTEKKYTDLEKRLITKYKERSWALAGTIVGAFFSLLFYTGPPFIPPTTLQALLTSIWGGLVCKGIEIGIEIFSKINDPSYEKKRQEKQQRYEQEEKELAHQKEQAITALKEKYDTILRTLE